MNCEIDDCITEARFHVTRIESRCSAFQKYMCESHTRAYCSEFFSQVSDGVESLATPRGLVRADFELMIWDYNPDEKETPAHLYLREAGGPRRFGTKIEWWVWSTMMTQLQQRRASLPVTHDAWAATIKELGGDLQDVVVDVLDGPDRWFHAKLRIVQNEQSISLNVRMGDGYVLAIVFGVPIFVAEKLMGTMPREGEN